MKTMLTAIILATALLVGGSCLCKVYLVHLVAELKYDQVQKHEARDSQIKALLKQL